MGARILTPDAGRDTALRKFADWAALEGETVARARTSETIRVAAFGRDLHLKRYRYDLAGALRGSLRNTARRPSRAVREYRMLLALGPDLAPRVVAAGEMRRFGLLFEAFVATETVEGGKTLAAVEHDAGAEALGRVVGRLHARGVVHGGLFPRNLLVTPDGEYRVIDLDRMRKTTRTDDLAFDLACLAASLRPPRRRCVAALAGYRHELKETEWRPLRRSIARRMPEAESRIDRRSRVR